MFASLVTDRCTCHQINNVKYPRFLSFGENENLKKKSAPEQMDKAR